MDGARGARLPLAKGFGLRGTEADGGLSHVVERCVKVSARELGGASLWAKKARLDCLITKNPPEVSLAMAG